MTSIDTPAVPVRLDHETPPHLAEKWCGIFWGDGRYMISDRGNVMSLIQRGKLLNPYVNEGGYMVIPLSNKAGTRKHFFVHRLVAEAFIPNDKDLPTVNHIDEDKLNNTVQNLEWMTHSDNKAHSVSTWCVFVSPDGEDVNVFNISEFARENGLDKANLLRVKNRQQSHHKGWTLKEKQ